MKYNNLKFLNQNCRNPRIVRNPIHNSMLARCVMLQQLTIPFHT